MAGRRRLPSNEPVERPPDLDSAIPFPPMEAELVRAGVPEARARQDVLALLESLRARGLVRLQAAS